MRVVILAAVPVWTLPNLEYIKHNGHYATWLEPLVPAMEKLEDLDIHWITMSKQTSVPITHCAYGQTFHILPRGSKAVQILTGYLKESLTIKSLIKKLAPDIVHAWGSEDAYGIAGSFSGVSNRIFSLQGSLSEYVRLLGGPLLFRLQALYEPFIAKRYRLGTAESPVAAELLSALNPKMKISLLDYGVNPDFHNATWNPADSPTVIFLGSVSKRKGIVDLIEIAGYKELSHITFKIVGQGELEEQLKETATPNVHWLGKRTRPEVITELETSWALVIPTYADTGPTVVKEARVVGLPVITTTQAGASSYISEQECGFVTKPGDKKAIAAAILKLCQSRDICMQYAEKGRELHQQLLHPSTTAANLDRIYKEMISQEK